MEQALHMRQWRARTILHAFFLLFLAGSTFAQDDLPDPELISAQLPVYPPIARTAHVQGDVTLEFALNIDGEPTAVTVLSKPNFLTHAAENNVKTWKFSVPKELSGRELKYTTTFHFKFSSDPAPYDNPKLTVVINSFRNVDVISNMPTGKYAIHCPTGDDVKPPAPIATGDFVKLSRFGCMGTCPGYEVTIGDTGEVIWKGEGYVAEIGERHAKIDLGVARTLIERFRTPEYWALCRNYTSSVTDSSGTRTDVRVGGRLKTVSTYADAGPEYVGTLELAIDAAANTHLWRHGEPRNESLANVGEDTYLPKPGVTELMKAAVRNDTAALQAAIAKSPEIDQEDSSGWTALFYAAITDSSIPMQSLLKAGADPNHRSSAGDTPLMAGAFSREFDEELILAGADVNAKNSAGVTVLMILAAKGEDEGVVDALKAGANAFAKDAKGRTALDYLNLANCNNSPIAEWHDTEPSVGECHALGDEEVEKIAAALKSAAKRPHHS